MRNPQSRRRACPFVTLLLAACLAFAGAVHAQAPAAGSGDATVDARLADVARYAEQYPEAFGDELVRYFDAPRELVASLQKQGWTSADIYYACVLARTAGRPCRYVTDDYARHPEGGWTALATRLGLAPTSPEFDKVRQAFAASYARWGRPLPSAPVPVPGKSVQTPRRH